MDEKAFKIGAGQRYWQNKITARQKIGKEI